LTGVLHMYEAQPIETSQIQRKFLGFFVLRAWVSVRKFLDFLVLLSEQMVRP
jgi:hypothetical protein